MLDQEATGYIGSKGERKEGSGFGCVSWMRSREGLLLRMLGTGVVPTGAAFAVHLCSLLVLKRFRSALLHVAVPCSPL